MRCCILWSVHGLRNQGMIYHISIITSMTIENRALSLARSFALSRYNHRAVIIALKASSFQNGSQIFWCFGVGNWSTILFSRIIINVIILKQLAPQATWILTNSTIRRYSRRLRRLIVKYDAQNASSFPENTHWIVIYLVHSTIRNLSNRGQNYIALIQALFVCFLWCLKGNPPENWAISIFSEWKPCTRII